MQSYNVLIPNDAKLIQESPIFQYIAVAVDAKMLQNRFMTTFEDYIRYATGESSLGAIERRTGIARATLTRKLKGIPPIETVVAISRAYNLNFLEVFVAAGYIRTDEAESIASNGALRSVTDRQLAEEILRRAIESEHSELKSPLRVIDGDPDYSQMSDEDVKSSYDLAALKKPKHIGDDELPHEP